MAPLGNAFLLLLPWFVTTGPPNPTPQQSGNEQRDWILSLRPQGDHVFACTADGLYRARLDKKRWEPLRGDTVPEPGGLFVADSAEEKTLLYFVTPAACRAAAFPQGTNATNKLRRPGLYRSADRGDSWELLNKAHDFQKIVHLPNGRLFALAGLKGDENQRQVVLLSENGGRAWKDVTKGDAESYSWLSFLRDPDHPQRVCLFSHFTMRSGGVILQAADDKFFWKEVHTSLDAPSDWPPDERKTQEDFFSHRYFVCYRLSWPAGAVRRLPEEFPNETFREDGAGISTCGAIRARLDSYFALPFRDDKTMSEFDIVPERPVYDFRPKQPLPVNVALTSYQERGPSPLRPRLVDARDARYFWSLKVSGPGGLKQDLRPKGRDNPFAAGRKGRKLEAILKDQDAWQLLLSPDKPARRTIDLRDLGMPDQPGVYRVQLRYQCSWADDLGISRSLDTVTGRVFTVRILAAGQ